MIRKLGTTAELAELDWRQRERLTREARRRLPWWKWVLPVAPAVVLWLATIVLMICGVRTAALGLLMASTVAQFYAIALNQVRYRRVLQRLMLDEGIVPAVCFDCRADLGEWPPLEGPGGAKFCSLCGELIARPAGLSFGHDSETLQPATDNG